MRIWMDSKGALVNDERVLGAIAAAGSLSAAANDIDFTLVSPSEDEYLHGSRLRGEGEGGDSDAAKRPRRRLADYLR